ncbi:hypothetical protein [Streptomyces sp. NPDC096030]|uniref:hypothetical protein n=1 Tax=Streptomyces sp. NPDC096030 TaxID=3155423 RepID=UPI0033239732
MKSRITRIELTEEIARTVRGVPGVAFLRPRLTGLRRATQSVPPPGGSGSGTAAGVRVREGADGTSWHVEVRLVALHGDRTLDVARAVRKVVEGRCDALLSGDADRTHVSVVVTGRV